MIVKLIVEVNIDTDHLSGSQLDQLAIKSESILNELNNVVQPWDSEFTEYATRFNVSVLS